MKKKVLIVVANYYKAISNGLFYSASDEINRINKRPVFLLNKTKKISVVDKSFANNIVKNKRTFIDSIIEVPGVFEIPTIIARNINKYDGFIALGCVIRGQTPHFEFISKATTDAIMKLSIEHEKPIGNGIITCLNIRQAAARKKKGREAALAVMSVLSS